METWLLSSLGYCFDTSMTNSRLPQIGMSSDLLELVQAHMAQISIVNARLVQALSIAIENRTISVAAVMEEAFAWHRDLPPELQLASLPFSNLPFNIEMPIYMLHLMYNGVHILHYLHMVCIANLAPGAGHHGMPDCAAETVDAARRIHHIVTTMMDRDGFRRTWLIISSAYFAGGILLLNTLQHLQQQGEVWQRHQDSIVMAKDCVEVLKTCAEEAPTARELVTLLSPHFHRLQPILNVALKSRTAEGDESDKLDSQPTISTALLEMIAHDLLELLRNPFGSIGSQRKVAHSHENGMPQYWRLAAPLPYNWPYWEDQSRSGLENMWTAVQAYMSSPGCRNRVP